MGLYRDLEKISSPGGGIYVEGEGERGEKGRNRWQIVQPRIWR